MPQAYGVGKNLQTEHLSQRIINLANIFWHQSKSVKIYYLFLGKIPYEAGPLPGGSAIAYRKLAALNGRKVAASEWVCCLNTKLGDSFSEMLMKNYSESDRAS